MRVYQYIVLLLVAMSLVMTGCKTQTVKPSGYLVNYKHLQPIDQSDDKLYYEDPDAPWKSYHSIMFSEVVIRVTPGEDQEKIDPEDLQKMRNYFQRALANSACSRLAFTNEPGEGVILLRSAIVDINPVNVAANIISKGLFFVPVDFGQATIEGELRDSVSGRHLASIVDREFTSGIDPTHTYTTWGGVEDAFDEWAEMLGEVLDRNMDRPTPTYAP